MADEALLCCELPCPACGAPVALPDGTLRFQWGLVPRRYAAAPAPLAWLRLPSGAAASAYEAEGGEEDEPWNAGGPEPGTVYAFDEDPRCQGLTCPRCGRSFERVAAQIEGDVLLGAVAFLPGELARRVAARPGSYQAVVVTADGVWEPRPDWEALEVDAPIREEV